MTSESQQKDLEQRRCEICRERQCKFRIHKQGFEFGIETCNNIDCLRASKNIFKFMESQAQFLMR